MPPRPTRPAAGAPKARGYQRGPHLRRRGRIYYAQGGPFGRGGESLHTEDPVEAERRLAVELAARADGRRGAARSGAPAPAPESSLEDCSLKWIAAATGYTRRTKESHEERVSAFIAWCKDHGATLPSEVTADLVDRWVAERAAKVSRRTINRDMRSARVCFRWCAERELCKPVAALERKGMREPKPAGHLVLPDPTEVSRTLAAMGSQGYRDALVIYYATGIRYEELQRVGEDDVERDALYVQPEPGAAAVAEPTKGYRGRRVPIAGAVRDVILRYLAWRDPEKRGRAATKTSLHRAIKAACTIAKVKKFGIHDLRRCFATESVRRGVPLTVVREWMGHVLVATTEGYIGRYRSDAAIEAPVSPVVTAAELLLNPTAKISTLGRQISKKAAGRGR